MAISNNPRVDILSRRTVVDSMHAAPVLWLNRAMKELIFLKLGGSLITDRTQPYTPRLDIIEDVALQISAALQDYPDLRLVIGHGSGSFGHVAASEYHTRDGLLPRASPLIHRERDQTEENYWKG